MVQRIPLNIISTLDNFFNTYDFYVKHFPFVPNSTLPFGQWQDIYIDTILYNYQIVCYYSYGNYNEIAKCNISIINGAFVLSEIHIQKASPEEFNKNDPSFNYY